MLLEAQASRLQGIWADTLWLVAEQPTVQQRAPEPEPAPAASDTPDTQAHEGRPKKVRRVNRSLISRPDPPSAGR